MKKTILFLILTLPILAFGQMGFEWINIHGDAISTKREWVKKIQTDAAGNVYVGGEMNTLFVRDSNGNVIPRISDPTRDSLYNNGLRDAWIASYTPQGVLRWHRYAGGSSSSRFDDMVVNQNGDIYVVGSVFGNQNYRPRSYNNTLLRPDEEGAYLAKLDQNGNLVWHSFFEGDTVAPNFYIPYQAGILGLHENSNNTISCYFIGGGQVIGTPYYQLLFGRDSLDYGIHEAIFDDNGNYLNVRSFDFPSSNIRHFPRITAIEKSKDRIVLTGTNSTDTIFVGNDTLIVDGFIDAVCLGFDTSLNHLWSFETANYFDQFRGAKLFGDTLIASGHFNVSVNSNLQFDTISHTGTPNVSQEMGLFAFDANNGRLLSMLPSRSNGFSAEVIAGGAAASTDFMAVGGLFGDEMTFSGSSNYMQAADNCGPLCTNYDCFFAVFDRNGNLYKEEVIYSSGNSGEGILAMHFNDSMLYVGGLIGDSVIIPGLNTLIAEGNNDAFIAAYNLALSTSIAESPQAIKADNGILAYPNPTEGIVNLFGRPLGREAVLYNLSGQAIRSFSVNPNDERQAISLEGLDRGVYVLIIRGSESIQSLKLIKQ